MCYLGGECFCLHAEIGPDFSVPSDRKLLTCSGFASPGFSRKTLPIAGE